MKTSIRLVFAVAALALATPNQVSAIEGLKISIHCPPGQVFGMNSALSGGGGSSALSLAESDTIAPAPARPLSSYPEGLVDAVLAGQTNYFHEFHFHVPVRTNGTVVFLSWEQVHG